MWCPRRGLWCHHSVLMYNYTAPFCIIMLNLPTHPDCDNLIPLWHETLIWDITVFDFGITMLHFSTARLHFMQQCLIMPSRCALTATLWLQNAVDTITSLHCDITMSNITCTILNCDAMCHCDINMLCCDIVLHCDIPGLHYDLTMLNFALTRLSRSSEPTLLWAPHQELCVLGS